MATPCARSCALVLIVVLALAIDVVSQHVSLARPLKGERLEAREVAEQCAHWIVRRSTDPRASIKANLPRSSTRLAYGFTRRSGESIARVRHEHRERMKREHCVRA